MGKYLLAGILAGCGAALIIIAGVVGFVVVPDIIDDTVEETVRLIPGTDTFDQWEINPVPVYLNFYMFHVNNPYAIELGERPNLTEIGPYVFSQTRKKHIDSINETSDVITYKQTLTYFFEEELSKDSNGKQLLLSDKINVVNLPFIATTNTLFTMGDIIGQTALNQLLNLGESFVKQDVTVGEAIFDGWKLQQTYNTLLALSPGGVPTEFQGGRFGFYNNKNGSTDGEYQIYRGLEDSTRKGEILKWNGGESLPGWWDNPENYTSKIPDPKTCNAINGTDGAVFQPFIKKEMKLQIFTSDICRSLELEFEDEDEFMGVKGYRYNLPAEFYGHPEQNINNYCFCPSPSKIKPGLKSDCAEGLIRLFTCRDGAPLVTSAPHFYRGQQEFRNKLVGLNPNKELHDTYILLQPETGFPLKVRKRIQMSLEVQNYEKLFHPFFNDVDHIIFPALWAEEATELNDELTSQIKDDLLTPVKIVDIVRWVVIALGIVLIGGGGFFLYRGMNS